MGRGRRCRYKIGPHRIFRHSHGTRIRHIGSSRPPCQSTRERRCRRKIWPLGEWIVGGISETTNPTLRSGGGEISRGFLGQESVRADDRKGNYRDRYRRSHRPPRRTAQKNEWLPRSSANELGYSGDECRGNIPSFPLQRQLFTFAFSCYFGSDLWRLPSNRYGPCEFSMFSMAYGRDCESDALRNRDASYTPFSESATRATRLSALKLRRQLHVRRCRLRSRTGTLWCARCWVSDARLLLVSSTASSQIPAQIRRAE
jgi:hypothetical protein